MSFSFDPAVYSDGYLELNIHIAISSATGSIADKLGAEGYIFILNWLVAIDEIIPTNINDDITTEQTEKRRRAKLNTF